MSATQQYGIISEAIVEEAAEVVREGRFTKPLVAYIAGRTLSAGMRFSHASAIIESGRGSAQSKIKTLEEVGAHLVEHPQKIAATLARILKVGEPR